MALQILTQPLSPLRADLAVLTLANKDAFAAALVSAQRGCYKQTRAHEAVHPPGTLGFTLHPPTLVRAASFTRTPTPPQSAHS